MENSLPRKVVASKTRVVCCILGTIIGWITGQMWLYTDATWNICVIGYAIAGFLVLYGSYLWATEKGRSGWWCLIGLLAPIGFIALAKLKVKLPIERR